ncbi:MAG TPA: MsnO8 family LLM class oxidoreductase [Sphingobacteriaceae bacterium]|nr:MsnO8 family LLM class oxidoreductase [Sphingobacteriaceae bacterium]
MTQGSRLRLSIVDVSPIMPGQTRHDAFNNSIALAQHAERLGYTRFWVAEHHGGRIGAGRAPEVLIAALGAHTKKIRLGSGAVLLNHYSPYKVAELFCTLNELYPGRIDLGVGRATAGKVLDLALQQDRTRIVRGDSDEQLSELVAWLDDAFPPDHPFARQPLRTIDSLPELHVLGSSPWSARAAGRRGLRYVYGAFLNHMDTPAIVDAYRSNFRPYGGPSGIAGPQVILAVHVVCAETEEEARRQLAPVHVMYRNLFHGDIDTPLLTPDEAVAELGGLPKLQKYIPGSRIPPKIMGGTPARVRLQLESLAKDLGLQEIMIQDVMTDQAARLRSYELIAEAMEISA